MYKISILGCGWLGSKLALHLINSGYRVKGSATKPRTDNLFKLTGIDDYLINIKDALSESAIIPRFFDCDILVVSLKPNHNETNAGYFINQVKCCAELAKKFGISRLIFISSTSVYGQSAQIVTETSEPNPNTPSGMSLIEAENILRATKQFDTTILRLGGLIGYDRNPVESVIKQKSTGSLYAPVNLVHADDVVISTGLIIAENIYNETFNVVADCHPLRVTYYKKAYEITGKLPLPFNNNQHPEFKIIDNTKIKQTLNYEFRVKNPIDIYSYKPLFTEI